MKRKCFILASTLLGMILPFGNIWGPFLVRCDKNLKKYRKYVVCYEIVATIVFYIVGTILWVKELALLSKNMPLNNTYLIYWLGLYYCLIIFFALINAIYLYFSKRTD
jgi:hypothetical protein